MDAQAIATIVAALIGLGGLLFTAYVKPPNNATPKSDGTYPPPPIPASRGLEPVEQLSIDSSSVAVSKPTKRVIEKIIAEVAAGINYKKKSGTTFEVR